MNFIELYEQLTRELIESFIRDQQEENLHLDFKTVNDASLDRDDRKALATALSGFANSDGGLIIWGVDARPNKDRIDCATAIHPIDQMPRLLAKLNEFTGSAVNPDVDGVIHRQVLLGADEGIAATLVPASDSGPHMAKAGEDRYFKRSGAQFIRMEHFDVEDMFGRRKRPKLSLAHRIILGSTTQSGGQETKEFKIVLGLHNSGRGSASAPYLGLAVSPPYRLESWSIDGRLGSNLQRAASPGGKLQHFVGTADVVLHPGLNLDVAVAVGSATVGGPLPQPAHIDFELAALDHRLYRDHLVIPTDAIRHAIGV